MRALSSCLVALLMACDARAPASPDASVALRPPAAAAAPELGVCRGMPVAHVEGPPTCEPWPAGARPRCSGATSVHVEGCTPVGRACGAPPPSAPGPVVFVDPAALPGGDGTVEAPYARLADALAAHPTDVTIRLAPGTHEAGLVIGDGVILEGACAAETTLTIAEGSEASAVIEVQGTGVVLRDLRITGPTVGLFARRAALTVEGVLVEDVARYGLASVGSQLTGRALSIRDVRGVTLPGTAATAGYGMTLEASEATLDDVVVERVNEIGVLVVAGTVATLEDVSILEVSAGPTGLAGVGLGISIDADATVDRLVVEGTERGGVVVEREARAVLRDVFVRDVRGLPTARPPGGVALDLLEGASVEADRLTIADVVAAITVAGGSTATLRDVRADDLHGVAPLGRWGHLLRATNASIAHLTRVHAEAVSDIGIAVLGTSVVEVEDLRLLGVAGAFDPDGAFDQATGMALFARESGHLRVLRAELAEPTFVAVAAAETAEAGVHVEDVVVRDVRIGPRGDLGGGRAILAISGASVSGARVRIERAAELAVSAWIGGRVTLADLVVIDTSARPDGRGGIALGAYGDGALDLTRFHVDGAAFIGLQLAFGASLPALGAPSNEAGGRAVLAEGRIERTPIGVNVQVPGTDTEALLRAISFAAVDRRLAADELPIPEPSTPELLPP